MCAVTSCIAAFAPRTQGKFDLTLYILFFFPGIFAMMVQGWFFFELSYLQNEHSAMSPDGPIIWPFKFVIPLAGALLLLQGLAEVVRCVQCIRTTPGRSGWSMWRSSTSR